MKILKAIAIFLIIVFCIGFIAGLSKGSDINSGLSFIGDLIGKVTEESIDNLTEAPVETPSESFTSDSTESTQETTEEISGEVDFSKLSINCLGDSVTYGDNGKNSASYVPALQDILGVKECINYGIAGSPVADIRNDAFIHRYSAMKEDADIILVFGGFNDAGQCVEIGSVDDTDASTFCGALNILITGLQEKYPEAYIFLIAPYKLFNTSTGQVIDESVVLANGYTRYDYSVAVNTVGEIRGIDVLDLWPLEIDESSFIDWVHPTEDFANNVLAPTIAQFIKDNYKKP